MYTKKNKIKKLILDSAGKQPVYIIADMACSHEGRYELAKRLVDAAASAGADAVQFQIFYPKEYIHPKDRDYEFVKKIALPPKAWIKLFERARKNNLEVIVVAADRKSIDLAESQDVDGYKLHSADLNNPYITTYIARLGKPITLSIGGSYWSEIQNGIKSIQDCGNRQIILMYGMQNFPTPFKLINLNSISDLKRKFKLLVGYQDHTDGYSEWAFWLPVMALGLGARVLEKHITHDRDKKGVDHEAALNSDEFHKFINMVRTAEIILGEAGIGTFQNLSKENKRYRLYSKTRKVVTARAIKPGEVITEKDIMVLRYQDGNIPAEAFPLLIGRRVRRNLSRHYPINRKDLFSEGKG